MGEENKQRQKWCPLSFGRAAAIGTITCDEACAWWNEYRHGCGLLEELKTIAIRLTELRKHFAPSDFEKQAIMLGVKPKSEE